MLDVLREIFEPLIPVTVWKYDVRFVQTLYTFLRASPYTQVYTSVHMEKNIYVIKGPIVSRMLELDFLL